MYSKKSVPWLGLDPTPSAVTTTTEVYKLRVSGSASDPSGIKEVQVRVDDQNFENVENLSGEFARWEKDVDLAPGQHRITVRTEDKLGNPRRRNRTISVRRPFVPGEVEQVFESTRYLRELLDFAERYLTIAGSPDKVTPAVLVGRFHQPFDRLLESAVFEQATRSVSRDRIAVEVLRRRLADVAAPGELDQRFRGMAYGALLRQLGTSYDDLRLARIADQPQRQASASRLGLGVLAARPDRLDELTISPDTITDVELEQQFGYMSTAAADDPLRPPPDLPRVPMFQLRALEERWQREDEIERDVAGRPLPIIDPDMIGEGNIRDQSLDNPAFALWSERQTFISETAASIEQQAAQIDDPASRLNELVNTFLGGLDIPALAARDAAGEDIRVELLPFELSLQAFRFLARSHALVATGDLLTSEWRDIFAILVQVRKQRNYLAWRLRERQDGIVLQPSTFTAGSPEADRPGRPSGDSQWRSLRAVYTAWRATLDARDEAARATEARYLAAVDATEIEVLPALRDTLVALMADQRPPQWPGTTSDWLTSELLIDLGSTVGTRTTRVDQALATLQAALFSARAGSTSGVDVASAFNIAHEDNFDRAWEWMGSYRTWLAAIRVFAYPENQLRPNLYREDLQLDKPTKPFGVFRSSLGTETRLTRDKARKLASQYLADLRSDPEVAEVLDDRLREDTFAISDELSNAEILSRFSLSRHIPAHQYQREVFWLVPMAIAVKLQGSSQFQAALDWYQTAYAYNLRRRRIWRGMTDEDEIVSTFDRAPDWLLEELNPHIFAKQRWRCYTHASVLCVADCLLAYADEEFSRNTAASNVRAQTLYQTAAFMLLTHILPDPSRERSPFPENPIRVALLEQAQSGLNKIRRGLNIAAAVSPASKEGEQSVLPSPYRYAVLVQRARDVVGTAQQIETAYLSALEQRDARAYDALQAGNDLQVARAGVTLQDLRVTEASLGVRIADFRVERANLQEDHYDQLISAGLNGWEQAGTAALGTALYLQTSAALAFGTGAFVDLAKAAVSFGLWGDSAGQVGQSFLESVGCRADRGSDRSDKGGL